jgi:hypothetical protein
MGMDDLPRLTTQTAIGIIVAISGNVLISLALNLQKLAHKRLDAQSNGHVSENGHMRPLLTPRRNRPSTLNEQDEDSDTITGSTTPPHQHSPTLESQPLLPVIDRSRNYTTLDREDDPPEIQPQKIGFFRRVFHSKKRSGKKKNVAVLPVDVMPEGPALRGLEASRKQTSDEDEDEENEGAYLKSKLWWVLIFEVIANHTNQFLGGLDFS